MVRGGRDGAPHHTPHPFLVEPEVPIQLPLAHTADVLLPFALLRLDKALILLPVERAIEIITGPVERLIDNGPNPSTTVIVRDTARGLTRDLGGARLAFREAGA